MAMHAAFGQPGSIRQAPDTLFAVFTNRVENANALAPQSHGVGPCSEGWLKSWKKSALQSTRSTTGCPALGAYPPWWKLILFLVVVSILTLYSVLRAWPIVTK